MSEQQGQAQPEKPADAYGKPISAERQAELQGFLDRWAVETDHSGRKGPFARKQGGLFGVSLTGADVSWLALGVRNAFDSVPDLHLEGANLNHSYLEGADIRYAHLESALLSYAHL
jgi:hypothetical protein